MAEFHCISVVKFSRSIFVISWSSFKISFQVFSFGIFVIS